MSALHVCRGNYTHEESSLLSGSYEQLSDFFAVVNPDILTLEFSTPRAGELAALFKNEKVKENIMLGLGVINPRTEEVESVEQIITQVEKALAYLPADRIWLNPDCGFSTFSKRPMNSFDIIEKKCQALAAARDELRKKYAN